MTTGAHRVQNRASDPLKLKSQMVVSLQKEAPATEIRFSVRAVWTLKH